MKTPDHAEQWVDPGILRPNSYNPNRMDEFMYQKAISSIKTLGFVNPVIVRSQTDYFEIIDGEHRVRAALDLGLASIPIWNLGPVDDQKAKQLTVVLNETRGQADREKLGSLLRDLLTSETTEQLLRLLPYQQEDFQALLNVPDFNWDDIGEITNPPSSASDRMRWVERIYRMPPEVAEVIDRAIASFQAAEAEDIPDWRALELICADWLGK